MEGGTSAFKIVTSKPVGKRPAGAPMHAWKDNIRIDRKEIVRGIWLIQLRIGIIEEPL
jgi:hypothetical protein